MRGAIIAAGDGSRFRAAGIDVPKPLLEIAGESLLSRSLRLLEQAGVESIALIVNGHMQDVAGAAKRMRLDVPLQLVVETTESSLHSLVALSPYLSGSRFVLSTVDSIMNGADFSSFVQAFRARPELDALLSYTDFIDDESPLRIAVGRDQRVTAVGPEASDSQFVTVGLYGMGPRVLEAARAESARGVTRLRRLLGAIARDPTFFVAGHRISKAIDVDRPCDAEQAEAFLLAENQP
jgi:NDP-sugar pyrophosphorylase family protein